MQSQFDVVFSNLITLLNESEFVQRGNRAVSVPNIYSTGTSETGVWEREFNKEKKIKLDGKSKVKIKWSEDLPRPLANILSDSNFVINDSEWDEYINGEEGKSEFKFNKKITKGETLEKVRAYMKQIGIYQDGINPFWGQLPKQVKIGHKNSVEKEGKGILLYLVALVLIFSNIMNAEYLDTLSPLRVFALRTAENSTDGSFIYDPKVIKGENNDTSDENSIMMNQKKGGFETNRNAVVKSEVNSSNNLNLDLSSARYNTLEKLQNFVIGLKTQRDQSGDTTPLTADDLKLVDNDKKLEDYKNGGVNVPNTVSMGKLMAPDYTNNVESFSSAIEYYIYNTRNVLFSIDNIGLLFSSGENADVSKLSEELTDNKITFRSFMNKIKRVLSDDSFVLTDLGQRVFNNANRKSSNNDNQVTSTTSRYMSLIDTINVDDSKDLETSKINPILSRFQTYINDCKSYEKDIQEIQNRFNNIKNDVASFTKKNVKFNSNSGYGEPATASTTYFNGIKNQLWSCLVVNKSRVETEKKDITGSILTALNYLIRSFKGEGGANDWVPNGGLDADYFEDLKNKGVEKGNLHLHNKFIDYNNSLDKVYLYRILMRLQDDFKRETDISINPSMTHASHDETEDTLDVQGVSIRFGWSEKLIKSYNKLGSLVKFLNMLVPFSLVSVGGNYKVHYREKYKVDKEIKEPLKVLLELILENKQISKENRPKNNSTVRGILQCFLDSNGNFKDEQYKYVQKYLSRLSRVYERINTCLDEIWESLIEMFQDVESENNVLMQKVVSTRDLDPNRRSDLNMNLGEVSSRNWDNMKKRVVIPEIVRRVNNWSIGYRPQFVTKLIDSVIASQDIEKDVTEGIKDAFKILMTSQKTESNYVKDIHIGGNFNQSDVSGAIWLLSQGDSDIVNDLSDTIAKAWSVCDLIKEDLYKSFTKENALSTEDIDWVSWYTSPEISRDNNRSIIELVLYVIASTMGDCRFVDGGKYKNLYRKLKPYLNWESSDKKRIDDGQNVDNEDYDDGIKQKTLGVRGGTINHLEDSKPEEDAPDPDNPEYVEDAPDPDDSEYANTDIGDDMLGDDAENNV